MLLILAGITINMLLDNNGIINKAQNAVNKMDEAQSNEINALNEIAKYINGGKVDFEEIFKTAQKPDDQKTTDDIGIAEDGSIVNLDYWTYTVNAEQGYCSLGASSDSYLGSNNGWIQLDSYSYIHPAYLNVDVVDGKIKGKVPMFIKDADSDDFYPVTDMSYAFYECTSLVEAPKIPSTVTNMTATFYGCSNLVTAPTIGENVTDLTETFRNCSKLSGNLKIDTVSFALGSSTWTYCSNCFYGAALAESGSTGLVVDCISEGAAYALEYRGGLDSNPNITIQY